MPVTEAAGRDGPGRGDSRGGATGKAGPHRVDAHCRSGGRRKPTRARRAPGGSRRPHQTRQHAKGSWGAGHMAAGADVRTVEKARVRAQPVQEPAAKDATRHVDPSPAMHGGVGIASGA
eukprot:6219583-Heterocapsa_arctica.AAC.1